MSKIVCLFLTFAFVAKKLNGAIDVPHYNGKCYIRPADINIGMLRDMHASDPKLGCDLTVDDVLKYSLQYVEAFKFTIDEINKNETILPNITLGYYIVDTCNNDLMIIARTMNFISNSNYINFHPDNNMRQDTGYEDDCISRLRNYSVVGVIGAPSSGQSLMIASLLSVYKVPTLSMFSTSDQLTDNGKYPYFMRLSPPDKFLSEAVVDFVLYHNWTYISMIYSKGKHIMYCNI